MNDQDLSGYAHGLLEEVRNAAENEGSEPDEAFTTLVLDQFNADGHSEDALAASFKEQGCEVSGYGSSSDDRCLDLFLTVYSPRADSEYTVDRSWVEAAFRRLENFLSRCAGGRLSAGADPASDIAGLFSTVEAKIGVVEKIRFFVVTNARSVMRDKLGPMSYQGRPVARELWDLRRLANWAQSGSRAEPIIAEFPEGLPCLATPSTDEDYSVFLAIVSGRDLADLYSAHGARLLELNVRSFLQTRGSVNKGIQETLRSTPERFLAYNNGISATASSVDFDDSAGQRQIKRIHNLQIVNGGQTTASIHHAHRNKVPVDDVRVQMKLTVVSPDKLDDIVPQISAFSNTQNKVTASDLKANSTFHVQIEQIMRTLWAPATSAHPHDTHWFYERARGQYANALANEKTPARQKLFKTTNPATQKFVKSDLAKFEHCWAMLPHEVSRGAEKNFVLFTERLEAEPVEVDKDYCRHLVAKAILFRRTDKIVAKRDFGGYKINIVAYTIAKLVDATGGRIDLDRIWREQDLSPALYEAINELSPLVQKVITSPPGGRTHVGEWAKRIDCWNSVRDINWVVPTALVAELLAPDTYLDDLRAVTAVPASEWAALAAWGAATGLMDRNQAKTATEISRALDKGWHPAGKHVRAGADLLQLARENQYPIAG